MELTFNFVGIEGSFILLKDFDKIASLTRMVKSSTKQGLKHNCVKVKQSRRERFDFKLKGSFLSGNVGRGGCSRWRKC